MLPFFLSIFAAPAETAAGAPPGLLKTGLKGAMDHTM
jgi:hypothetical protein